MISIILFLLGAMLYNRRKAYINFLRINAEGDPVRTAGIILMLPFAGSIILGLILGISTGNNLNALFDAIENIAFLELAGDLTAMITAYAILRRSNSVSSTPTAYPSATRPAVGYRIPPAPVNFPSVMSSQEAARYLNVPEQRIIDAIYNGELAAASIGNRYKISRQVLDEYREKLLHEKPK